MIMNTLFKVALGFILGIVLATASVAQTTFNRGVQSPTAASLGKYGDTPVSLYRGQAQVGIPIYTLSYGDISVPISLSYSGSGLKVEQVPGWVGLGWSLNAGGVITRTVRGVLDEKVGSGYLDSSNHMITYYDPSASFIPQSFFNNLDAGSIDGEPDVFYYNFNGYSGKFIFDYQGNIDVLDGSALKVEFTRSGSVITRFDVTDPNGIVYEFSERETTSSTSLVQSGPAGSTSLSGGDTYTSGWYLKKISSPITGRSINFTYNTYAGVARDRLDSEENVTGSGTTYYRITTEDVNSSFRHIATISGGNETVTFANSTRTDFAGERKLDRITITRNGGQLSRFDFTYGYTTPRSTYGNSRLRLDKVTPRGTDNTATAGWELSYYAGETPSITSEAFDLFGYYNGKHGNEGGTLRPYVYDAEYGLTFNGDDRAPAAAMAQRGMLHKITYPTGGHTEFEYEGNVYVQQGQGPFYNPKSKHHSLVGTSILSSTSTNFTIGGDLSSVTVTSVVSGLGDGGLGGGGGGFGGGGFGGGGGTSCTGDAQLLTSTGVLVDNLVEGTNTLSVSTGTYKIKLTRTSTACAPDVTLSWTEQTSVPTQNVGAGGLRIAKIIQHDGVSTANDIEKTYHYNSFSTPSLSSGYVGNPIRNYFAYNIGQVRFHYHSSTPLISLGDGGEVGYTEVEERISGGQGGYTRYYFSKAEDALAFPFVLGPPSDRGYARGQLLKQETYDTFGNILQKTENVYQTRNFSDDHGATGPNGYFGVKLKFLGSFKINASTGGQFNQAVYVYSGYSHRKAWQQTDTTRVTTYDPVTGDANETYTRFYYSNVENRKLLTAQREFNSNGEGRLTTYTFAHNYYSALKTANRLSLPYSTEIKDLSNKVLSKNWTTYSSSISGAGGKWQPYQTWQWKGSSSADTSAPSSPSTSEANVTATVNTYDTYANPLQVTDGAGNITKYYFGNNSSPFTQTILNGVYGMYLTGIQKVKGSSNCNNCGTRPGSGDDLFTEAEYDSRGRLTKMYDENNKSTQYTYDVFSRLVNSYNQNGTLVSQNQYYFSKLGNGGNYSATDPNRVQTLTYAPGGTITSVNYMDGLGRATQTQQRGGGKTIISETRYNDEGLPLATSRPVERSNQNSFFNNLFEGVGSFTAGSALNYASAIEDYYQALPGTEEDYAYTHNVYEASPLARSHKSTLPGPLHKMNSGREVLTTYGVNTTETFYTSAQGSTPAKTWGVDKLNKVITEDPDGKKTISYTNSWGQTIASGTDMNGDGKLVRGSSGDLVTEFAYDLRGNMVRSEDPRGLATTYTYDQRGLLVEKKLPDQTHPHKYRYDKKGRLRFHRDPVRDSSGDHYYYTKYDQFDRPTETGKYNSSSYFDTQSYIDNASWPTSNKTAYIYYSYDGSSAYSGAQNTKGRLTRTQYWDVSSSSWGYTWYSYNNQGLVEWVVQRIPELTGDKRVEYEYDALGRMTRLKYNPSGTAEDHYFWYEYDGLGRMEYVYSNTVNSTSGRIKEAQYTYNADGQPKQIRYGNSNIQYVDYLYTVQGWLDKINNGAISGTDKFGMNLDYNYNGNVSLQQFRQAGAGNTNLVNYYYYYDTANRLTSANFSGSGYGSSAFDASYSYDQNGNVTSLTRTNNGTYPYESVPGITYSSSSNRITNISYQPGPVPTSNKSVSYDANGNTTVHQVQNITSTSYDWRNLAYRMVANGTTLDYAYDADAKRVKKEVVGGTKTHYVRGANGETVAIYENGSRKNVNLLAGADVIGSWDGSQRRYFIKDHLGSTRTTVDQSGNVDGYDDYYAFGLAMPGRSSNSANPTDNYKFTGHERDAEAGLTIDYMNARTYDPIIGRFLQVDPAMEFASPYSYVGSNPLKFTDPTGMMSEGCCTWADFKEGVRRSVVQAKELVTTEVNNYVDYANSFDLSKGSEWGRLVTDHVPLVSYNAQDGLSLNNPVESVQAAADNVQTQYASLASGDANVKSKVVMGITFAVVKTLLSRRAATRQAKRDAGIPTSQQFDSQVSTPGGRQQVYTVDGKPKIVTNQLMDRNHGPHVEAGSPKANGQRDPGGRLRHDNNKVKVEYDKKE